MYRFAFGIKIFHLIKLPLIGAKFQPNKLSNLPNRVFATIHHVIKNNINFSLFFAESIYPNEEIGCSECLTQRGRLKITLSILNPLKSINFPVNRLSLKTMFILKTTHLTENFLRLLTRTFSCIYHILTDVFHANLRMLKI